MTGKPFNGAERVRFVQQLLEQHSSITSSTYQQILDALDKQKESFGYTSNGKMKVAFFDMHSYDKDAFSAIPDTVIDAIHIKNPLSSLSAIQAKGCLAVCIFVNDDCGADVVEKLAFMGVKLIALRCEGYNNVDLEACEQFGIHVVRVPEYSPYAVAEHAVALMLMLNRKLHKAYMRNQNGQYVLDGLVGFDMRGRTVGIIGLGKIGKVVAEILSGFGCAVVAYDINQDEDISGYPNLTYVTLDELIACSDIISLHAPLTDSNRYMVNNDFIGKMKQGAMLINTGRGALVDTKALIAGLKSGQIGSAGIDVYEEEADIFFKDRSTEVLTDDIFARLTTFNNVIITSHQGFLTHEALYNIAKTTMENLHEFHAGKRGAALTNRVKPSSSNNQLNE
jgi:D-lactate dehydrogenase